MEGKKQKTKQKEAPLTSAKGRREKCGQKCQTWCVKKKSQGMKSLKVSFGWILSWWSRYRGIQTRSGWKKGEEKIKKWSQRVLDILFIKSGYKETEKHSYRTGTYSRVGFLPLLVFLFLQNWGLHMSKCWLEANQKEVKERLRD